MLITTIKLAAKIGIASTSYYLLYEFVSTALSDI